MESWELRARGLPGVHRLCCSEECSPYTANKDSFFGNLPQRYLQSFLEAVHDACGRPSVWKEREATMVDSLMDPPSFQRGACSLKSCQLSKEPVLSWTHQEFKGVCLSEELHIFQ